MKSPVLIQNIVFFNTACHVYTVITREENFDLYHFKLLNEYLILLYNINLKLYSKLWFVRNFYENVLYKKLSAYEIATP